MSSPIVSIAPPPSQRNPREIELGPHGNIVEGICKVTTLAGTVTVATAPARESERSPPVSPDEDGFYQGPAIKITAGADGARIKIEYPAPPEKRH